MADSKAVGAASYFNIYSFIKNQIVKFSVMSVLSASNYELYIISMMKYFIYSNSLDLLSRSAFLKRVHSCNARQSSEMISLFCTEGVERVFSSGSTSVTNVTNMIHSIGSKFTFHLSVF